MTERPENADQAERIRRLQERRAASSRSRDGGTQERSTAAVNPTAATVARPASPTGRNRRRHPAGASRILLAGLSVASFFTIGGSLMLAQNNAATVSQATPAVVGQVAITGTTTSPATSATSATPAAAATKASTQSVRAAHTTTRAS
jgi:hypothetical protein